MGEGEGRSREGEKRRWASCGRRVGCGICSEVEGGRSRTRIKCIAGERGNGRTW